MTVGCAEGNGRWAPVRIVQVDLDSLALAWSVGPCCQGMDVPSPRKCPPQMTVRRILNS